MCGSPYGPIRARFGIAAQLGLSHRTPAGGSATDSQSQARIPRFNRSPGPVAAKPATPDRPASDDRSALVSPGRKTGRVQRCDESEVVLSDGLGQGRDDRAGLVVGPRYEERGAVLAERDRAALRPGSEVLGGRYEVAMGVEAEPARGFDPAVHQVACQLERSAQRGTGRPEAVEE